MTQPVLLAVLDTLLPGDDGNPPLPAFSQAGIDVAPLAPTAQAVLTRIDHARFVSASATERAATLRLIEQESREALHVFLNQALAAYYQSPRVLAALRWRSEPPQPTGHRLDGDDEIAWRMLSKVRGRGALWRK